METAWGIFLHDLKKLSRNKVALGVAIALLMLSCGFAWCATGTMWNPCSNTAALKVAVVNDDEGVPRSSIKGLDREALSEKLGESDELNVGGLVVEAMRLDGGADWCFVDAEQGEAGLASGEYYAEFVLPAHFTSEFLEVLAGDLERPTVECRTNGKNGVDVIGLTEGAAGSSAAESVMGAVVTRVFVTAASHALHDVVTEVASDLLDSRSSDSSMLTGLAGAKRDLENVEKNVEYAGSVTERWKTASSAAREKLDSLAEGIPTLRDALADGARTLADARTSAHEAANAYSSMLRQGDSKFSTAIGKVFDQVEKAISDISAKQESVDAALKKAVAALDESDRLVTALRKADPDSKALADLEKQNGKLRDEVEALEKASEAVAGAADDAGETTERLSKDVVKSLGDASKRAGTFNDKALPQIDTSLDTLALVMGSLDGSLGALGEQVSQATATLDALDGALENVGKSFDGTTEMLDEAADGIDAARSDLSALANPRASKKRAAADSNAITAAGSSAATLVDIDVQQVYPLNSYGAALAPLYAALAMWLMCLMVVFAMRLGTGSEEFPEASSWQLDAGRLLLLGALALLQGAVVTAGDLLLGVQAASPVAFIVAGLAASFCFAGVVYAITALFKHVGKALAAVFLVIQVPVVLGAYPAQLMPELFQSLASWMPLSYGMDAMREAIGGFSGSAYAADLLWLLACGFTAPAVALLVRFRFGAADDGLGGSLSAVDLFEVEAPAVDAALSMADTQRALIARQVAPLVIAVLTVALFLVAALLGLDAGGKTVAIVVYALLVAVALRACATIGARDFEEGDDA